MQMKQLKELAFLLVAMVFASPAIAQTVVKGQVLSAGSNESLVGVTVATTNNAVGTATDLNGYFELKVTPNAKLTFSYIGFKTLTVSVDGKSDLGIIFMKEEEVLLKDVVVTASIAVDRQTPIAISTIDPIRIEEKLGTQEFPEILKSTPSVYATKEGEDFLKELGFAWEEISETINHLKKI
ncbi:hypothetical protein FACS1894182_12760 [Bacteroidia bacterium]|nr:hypothetical protein FACS1894182_12760 [Bacteroidia bacterium]